MIRALIAAPALLCLSLTVPATAPAATPKCESTGSWRSPTTGDTWTFERCAQTMSVSRGGGLLGPCTNTYPVGSVYRSADDDCGYYLNGGPL